MAFFMMNRSARSRILSKSLVVAAVFVSLSGCVAYQTGNSPLILAAWHGDAKKVADLLRGGADVNAANREGLTPLMASTWGKTGHGDVAIAKALIAKGANVNAANIYGRTALMEVSGNGNVEFVKLLLDAGADANAKTTGGQTALHDAALTDHGEIVRALLTKGARPNVTNELGQTPLMLACTCAGPSNSCPERPEIVRLLLAAGADVNARDARGQTAWQWVNGGTRAERDEVKRILKTAGATN